MDHDSIRRQLAWEHKCDSCLDEFATCTPENIVFGIDKDPALAFTQDADKVLECSAYMHRLPDLPEGVKR